jgi:carbonic anhydrase
MGNIYLSLSLFIFFISSINSISSDWRKYSSCKIGRLQSPIALNEYDSDYSNSFSFVYEYYKTPKNITKIDNSYTYTLYWNITDGGFVNFEKQGVIKQYELEKIELYTGIHKIDGKKGDYELHLVHKKNLDFNSNKNQYRKIVDANMYLTVVLRYKNDCNNNDDYKCISDNGLLSHLTDPNTNLSEFDLNQYPIYQDKRAYFYEGSFLYAPCDENVNYYVINDFFNSVGFNQEIINNINDFNVTVNEQPKYGRPVLKNFMNYREFLNSENLFMNMYLLIFMICMLFV